MSQLLFNLEFDVQPQGNGRLLATSRTLPIMVSAADYEELQERCTEALTSLRLYLASLDEAAVLAYLSEHGVTPETETSHFRVPVLIGA